jgi:hypothetical protein
MPEAGGGKLEIQFSSSARRAVDDKTSKKRPTAKLPTKYLMIAIVYSPEIGGKA